MRVKTSNCVGLTVLFSNAWKTRTEKCITTHTHHHTHTHHQLPEPQASKPNRHPVSTNRVRSHVLPSPLTFVFSSALPTCMRNLLAHKCTDMHAHMHKTHTHAHKERVRTEEVGATKIRGGHGDSLALEQAFHGMLCSTTHAMHVHMQCTCKTHLAAMRFFQKPRGACQK